MYLLIYKTAIFWHHIFSEEDSHTFDSWVIDHFWGLFYVHYCLFWHS